MPIADWLPNPPPLYINIGFGLSKKRFQLAKVENCALTNVGELPFDFYLGGCNTFSFGVMLCFPWSFAGNTYHQCHS